MITQFRVQNYKALRDVTLNLTPVHVLIGPNDSGKTSCLSALAALCRSVEHPIASAFLGSWQGNELVTHGTADCVSLKATIGGMGEIPISYGFDCVFASKGRDPQLTGENVRNGDSRGIRFQASGSQTVLRIASIYPDQAKNYFQSDPTETDNVLNALHTMYEALFNIAFHRWEPRFLSLPVAPDSSRRFRMDHNGFGLALCLDDILGFDRERFGQLEDRFRSIFPQVKAIRLIAEPAYRSPVDNPSQVTVLQKADGKGIHLEFLGQAKLVPASQLSDGLLIVLAYLAILYLPEPPRVLLIEEPENGIHPARLKEIIRILKQLVSEQSHTQVLMTTHSPYVVHEFEPNEVTLCVRDKEGAVQTRRLSESQPVREQMDFFSLGEIWTLDGDEALMQPIDEIVQPAATEATTSP